MGYKMKIAIKDDCVIIELVDDPESFSKERSGRKKNTVKKFTENEESLVEAFRFVFLPHHIKIVNSETLEFFTRELSDVSFWKDDCIFSWR